MISLFILIASLSGASAESAPNPVVIGVLETPQCREGQPVGARLLFAKVGGRWESLDQEKTYPPGFDPVASDWIVALDGRKLGSLKLSDPSPGKPSIKEWNYGRDKLYRLVEPSKAPKVRNTGSSFHGWCNAPENRPLVLVSRSNFEDPEGWKPFQPDSALQARLFPFFRIAVGQFNACLCNKEYEFERPWDYTPDDLVLHRSYRSKAGLEIVSLGLDLRKPHCDNMSDPFWGSQWFLVREDRIDFLGSQMELVDAGDYDRDGRSELLFWHAAYDKDGYRLIYDDFRQSEDFFWSYH